MKDRCTSLALPLLPWQRQLCVRYSHDNRLSRGRWRHAHFWWQREKLSSVTDKSNTAVGIIASAVKWIPTTHIFLPCDAVLMSLGILGLPSPAQPYAPTLTLYTVFTFRLPTSTSYTVYKVKKMYILRQMWWKEQEHIRRYDYRERKGRKKEGN